MNYQTNIRPYLSEEKSQSLHIEKSDDAISPRVSICSISILEAKSISNDSFPFCIISLESITAMSNRVQKIIRVEVKVEVWFGKVHIEVEADF